MFYKLNGSDSNFDSSDIHFDSNPDTNDIDHDFNSESMVSYPGINTKYMYVKNLFFVALCKMFICVTI